MVTRRTDAVTEPVSGTVTTGDGLTEREAQWLTQWEDEIEQNLQYIGETLRFIRDRRLYRGNYPTFEAYCKGRWGITPRHANRQIAASEVADALEKALAGIGPIGHIPEGQARELVPLLSDPERLREVWEAVNEATNHKPTAAAIRAARDGEPEVVEAEVVVEFVPPPRIETREERAARETAMGHRDTCMRIAECVRFLDGGGDYARLFLTGFYPHEAEYVPYGMRLELTRVRSAIEFLSVIEGELAANEVQR